MSLPYSINQSSIRQLKMGGLCCKVIYFISPNAIERLTEPAKYDLYIYRQNPVSFLTLCELKGVG